MEYSNHHSRMELSKAYQTGLTSRSQNSVSPFMMLDSAMNGSAASTHFPSTKFSLSQFSSPTYTQLSRVPMLPSMETFQQTSRTNGRASFERRCRNPIANHESLPSVECVAEKDARYLDAHTHEEVQQVLADLARKAIPGINSAEMRDILIRFDVCGFELERMGLEQFRERHCVYGPLLYREYQKLKSDFEHPSKDVERALEELCWFGKDYYTIDSDDMFEDIDDLISEELGMKALGSHYAASNAESSQDCYGKSPSPHGNLPKLTEILRDECTDTDIEDFKNCSIRSPSDSGFYTETHSECESSIASPFEEVTSISEMMDESNDSIIESYLESSGSESAMCCDSPDDSPRKGPTKKKSCRGRPTKEKGNHLWEFLLELLHLESNRPRLLRWENREMGIFRILKSKELAELWGLKKDNKKMTYEKMSRALRDYYKDASRKMTPIYGRLLFQFGPEVPWREYYSEVETRRYTP